MPGIVEIPLTKGFVSIVDADCIGLVGDDKWHAMTVKGSRTIYAQRTSVDSDGKKTCLLMHRVIMGAGRDQVIDHRNRNGLDNRRDNLRLCTRAQNMQNVAGKSRRNKYKGIYFDKFHKSWRAEISVGGSKMFLGYFKSEDLAASAYNSAAIRFFGEFAFLNTIGEFNVNSHENGCAVSEAAQPTGSEANVAPGSYW